MHPQRAPSTRDRLEGWRAITARAAGIPAAVVLTDPVLEELLRQRPRTIDQLRTVRGLGAIKADRFGPDLLAALGTEEES